MIEYHRARRLALQGLCCLDVQGGKAADLVRQFLREGRDNLETIAEAEGLLEAALAHRPAADGLLARETRHWGLERMSLVDRNVLRLATAELLTGRTPKKIVISEAVRLADEFSTAESYKFVNGVLDAVARRIDGRDAGDTGDKKEND